MADSDPKKSPNSLLSGVPRSPDGRFIRGHRGNPAGRPPGIRGPAAQLALEIIAQNVEVVTRKVLERAVVEGDRVLLKLCLDRLLGPVRGRPSEVTFDFTPDDYGLVASLDQLLMATRDGEYTPEEALRIAAVLKLRNEKARRLEWEGPEEEEAAESADDHAEAVIAAKEPPDVS